MFKGKLKKRNRRVQREEKVPRVLACEESVKYRTGRKRQFSIRNFWETINSNNTLLIFLVVAGLLIAIAIGTYIFEFGVNDRIRSLWDTMWWTIVTLTTVGGCNNIFA